MSGSTSSTVTRELGRHKGDTAHLMLEERMVERAIDAARAITAHSGYSTAVFDAQSDHIIERMTSHLMNNMYRPAIDLLSDFCDDYTASGDRITEMHVDTPTGTTAILKLTASLRRVPPATVRFSGITVQLKTEQ